MSQKLDQQPVDPRPVNPRMVVLARESRGWTQAELAERLAVTQSKISKIEAGLLDVSAPDRSLLAQILDYPEHLFEWTDPVYGFASHEMFHRKRQKATAKLLSTLHAQLNIRRMQLERLLRSIEIQGDGFRCVDPDEYDGDIERIAQVVRAAWHLPPGPIENVTQAIENAGGVVIPHEFQTRHVDAISQWVPGLPPVFFVNARFPADRMRYTLCHEVGHMLLHRTVTPQAEVEADRFAAELLMPARSIRADLLDLSLPALASLKQYWRVSMAALLKRAGDLAAITPRQARTLWMRMGKLGYRTHEPIQIPPEEPTLFREILEFHTTQLRYSIANLGFLLADNHVAALFEKPNRRLTVVV